MNSNFERLQKIINQAYDENFNCQFHLEPRNLPRYPKPWPGWSGPFHFSEGCKVFLARKLLPCRKTKQRKFRRFRNRENMSWARPVACGLLDSWNFCSLLASISWVFAWKGRWNLTAWSSTYALGSVGGGATFKTQPKEKILFNMILMKIRHHIAQID